MAEKFEKMVDEASVVTVAVHTHPDGDAIGSGSALTRFLRLRKGKEAALLVPNRIPGSLQFIQKEGDIVLTYDDEPDNCQKWISRSDLVICQDCNSFDRIPGAEPFLRASKARKVLIDHHLNPDSGDFDLVISETAISSASELLYQTLKGFRDVCGKAKNLPMTCLEALMTGMTTDTNNFANSVFPSTLQMASELLDAGVNRDAILYDLYNRYPERRLRLMGYMLHDKLKITDYGVAYMILDKATQDLFGFEDGDTEGFVNMPLSLEKVNVSIFLTQEKDKFRVSIRSKIGYSANMLAQTCFNGGGHEHAAGGSLWFEKDIKAPEEAEEYILKASKAFFCK